MGYVAHWHYPCLVHKAYFVSFLFVFHLIGHIRALCLLAPKIVMNRDAIVTLLVPNRLNIIERVVAEVQRSMKGTTPRGEVQYVFPLPQS